MLLTLLSFASATTTVNETLGDTSWFQRHPGQAFGTEQERIATHLAYVETTLRNTPTRLSPAQHQKRTAALDALRAYRLAGQFPQRGVDGYPDRQPQFIDSRGVPCAVGAMLQATGHQALAATLDREEEFSHILDMESPALKAWAQEHGFTRIELAMIQPSYRSVPTRASTEFLLKELAPRAVLTCAPQHPFEPSLKLHLSGDSSGKVTVSGSKKTRFQRCMLAELENVEDGGGAYMGSPVPYSTNITLRLDSPQAQLKARLVQVNLSPQFSQCALPGVAVDAAEIAARVTADGGMATVTTKGSNPTLDACLSDHLSKQLQFLYPPGIWEFEATHSVRVPRSVDQSSLKNLLEAAVSRATTACYSPDAPASLTAEVRTTPPHDLAVEIIDASKHADFSECVLPKIKDGLAREFTVHSTLTGGEFLHIDSTGTHRGTVEVEPPRDRSPPGERYGF